MNRQIFWVQTNPFQLNQLSENGALIGPVEMELDENRIDWILKHSQEGRLIILNESGRWTSCQDYKKWIPSLTKRPESKVESSNYVLTQLNQLSCNPDLFNNLVTNTPWDEFASNDGGFLPGTNTMVVGAPGTGKTTVLMELLSSLHTKGNKVLFVSAEMNQIDMLRYLKRFPNWGTLPILFLNDAEHPKHAIETVFNQGWDLILIDSYTEVNDTIKETEGWSRGKCEKWFLDLMNRNNMAQNIAAKHTSFLTILQLNKGGSFVGSNKLKHMTSAMLHMDWEGKENQGERYMWFSKNRLGKVGNRLYFDITHSGLEWNEARWKREIGLSDLIEREKQQLEKDNDLWDRIFGEVSVLQTES